MSRCTPELRVLPVRRADDSTNEATHFLVLGDRPVAEVLDGAAGWVVARMSYVADAPTPYIQWDGSVVMFPNDDMGQRLLARLAEADDAVAAVRPGEPWDEASVHPRSLLHDPVVGGPGPGASS